MKSPPNIRWISTATDTRQQWTLQVIEPSIINPKNKPYGYILVSQDQLHTDTRFETFNDRGVYLGKMDKDTMLLYAEAVPKGDRYAMPFSDAK